MINPSLSRRVAARVLESLETRGGFANELLQALWESMSGRELESVHPSERALTREMVYGVCRCRNRLDWALDQVSDRPVESLDVRLQTLLRLGAYQILELERIPVWAAISETVDLAKSTGRARASGFVNAVLRHLARRKEELARPTFEDPMDKLVLGQSHPRWLVERWMKRFGHEATAAILEAHNERAPLSLRVNTLKSSSQAVKEELQKEGFLVKESSVVPGMLRLESWPREVTATEIFRSGACIIQDEAAALVGFLSAPKPGETILDACAAPGGKTTHLAEHMKDRGAVIAMDRWLARMQRLVRQSRRMGFESILPVVGDALAPPVKGPFNLVLLDTPCSGLGVLRRHPEGRWLKGPEIIGRHAELQFALLNALADWVAEEGALIYSVCSFEPEETTDLVAHWLADNHGWMLEDSRPYLPEAAHRWVTEDGAMCILPEPGGPDGFFAIRLRRKL